jgi:uncharacterized protein YciI
LQHGGNPDAEIFSAAVRPVKTPQWWYGYGPSEFDGSDEAPMETGKNLFVVMRRYGPPYDPQKPLEAQLHWEHHRIFMNALEAEGLARLAGPLVGTDEVLLVFRAESADEIETRLTADPWTQSGILSTTRIVGWNLRLGEVG